MGSQILTFDRSGLTLRSTADTSIPLPGIDTNGVNNVVAGSLSADGVDDIVVARDDGSFAWYDNQPGGAAPIEHTLDLPLISPALAGLERVTELRGIADANGDGRNDVIVTSYVLRTDISGSPAARPDGIFHINPLPVGDNQTLPTGDSPVLSTDVSVPVTSSPIGDVRPDGLFHINPNAGGTPTPSGAPSVPVTSSPTGDVRPDGLFHINPNAGGTPTPSGAPAEEPTFTIQPFPYPARPVLVDESGNIIGSDSFDLFPIDFSNIKVDLRGVLLTTGNEVYIPPTGNGIAVGEYNPNDGRYAEVTKQIYGVDTDTGNLYVIWDDPDISHSVVALGNLDGRGGIDVLYQDRTTGDLYIKNDLSDGFFVTNLPEDGTVSVAAVGNFSGDNSLDEILFYDASTREFSVWVHPPFDIATTYLAGSDYFQTVFKLDFGSDFVGTQDIDGDGIEDIIVATVGDFAPHIPGSSAPVSYFSSVTHELVALGSFDPDALKGIGNFFDGPSIL